MFAHPQHEVLLATDSQYKHYRANEYRVILKDGLLFQNITKSWYHQTSPNFNTRVNRYQKIPEPARGFRKTPQIYQNNTCVQTETLLSNMANLIRKWVTSCKQRVRESGIESKLSHPHVQNPRDYVAGPEDALQIDSVLKLSQSNGYGNFVTAMDVFSRYLFAYPTLSQDAKIISRVHNNCLTELAYLPTTIITDKGSAFV